MKRAIVYCTVFSLIFVSCKACNNKNDYKQPDTLEKNIVIIFQPSGQTERVNTGLLIAKNQNPTIRYVTDSLIVSEKSINNAKNADTAVIQTKTPILLEYRHLALLSLYYYFMPGDTVVFSYKKNIPVCTVKNRDIGYYNLNFFMENEVRTIPSLIPKVGLVLQKDLHKKFQASVKRLDSSLDFLNSLHTEKKICDDYYFQYRQALHYISYIEILRNINTDKEASAKFDEFKISNQLNKDSLAKDTYYQNFLQAYLWNYFMKGKIVTKSSAQRTYDYPVGFETSSEKFKGNDKKILTYNCLLGAYENYPTNVCFPLFEEFKKIGNKTQINYIEKNLLLTTDISNADNNLIDASGQKITLTDIISLCKGKVIYVDFWASWCGPCRQAMPASVQLRNNYKNKPIVFIYISIDKNMEQWKNAAREENMNNYEQSYILLNPENAAIAKDLHITSIPRYIIFNKSGKIIYKDAPAPDGKDIYNFLGKEILL